MVRRGCEAHSGSCVRSLRADGKRGSPGRIDRAPRKPIRVGVARQELPNRRHSGRGAGASRQKRRRLQGPGPNGKPVRDPGRRIASAWSKRSPVCSAEATTPSLDAWRSYSAAMKGAPDESTISGNRLIPEARDRDRPQICDGLCPPRARASRPRRDRTRGAEYSQSLSAAGSSQRQGKLLHHFHLHRR